jgi:PAS domain S-box-containing protein
MPNWSFGKSIKTQLIVLLFGLTFVCIGVIGYLGVRAIIDSGAEAERITSEATQQRVESFLIETTTATASKNSVLFRNIQNQVTTAAAYTKNVFDNPQNFTTGWRFNEHVFKQPSGQWWNSRDELANILIGAYVEPDPAMKRKIELLHNLDLLALQMLKGEPNAVALYFIGTRGESFYYPNIDLGSIIPPDLDPSTLEFFTVANPKNDPKKTVKWTKVYDDPAGNGLTITASHPVYTSDNAFSGVMSIDVTLSNIAKNIEDYSPIESSYAFLVDNEGRAIALPKQAYLDILGRQPKEGEFGPDLKGVTGDFGAVFKEMRAGKSGFGEVKTDDNDLYVAYAPVSGTPFSLAIAAKVSSTLKVVGDLRSQVKNLTNSVLYFQILPIAVIILVFVWLLGFIYIRFVTGPISAMTVHARKIMGGDFSPSNIEAKSDNEVGELATAFNKMTGELAKSYQDLKNKVTELGDAKAKDEAILNSIGEGVVVTDARGKIVLINVAASELLGTGSDELIGKEYSDYKLFDASGKQLEPSERPIMLALKSVNRVERDVQSIRSQGIKSSLAVTAAPVVQEGEVIGAVEILRDVTKEKEIDRVKTEFITVASHQLRTPLSAIKWFGEMLLTGDAGKLKGQQVEFVRNISESTDRMIELVNALLNISRLESGHVVVDPHPTDLRLLIEGILGELRAKADEHKIKLEVTIQEPLPKVNIDAQLVSQVYLNLLSNAIKYTQAEGKVDLKVTLKDDEILTEVSDSGLGVPEAEQAKMFQKFFRGSNITKVETDGTGLGLYFTKAIIESSGGRIWFKSEEGKGTTFWFTLPAKGEKASGNKVDIE